MANLVYNHGKFLLANGALNVLTDNLALLLVASTYTPSAAANTVEEIASFEITTGSVSGYTRLALTNKAVTEDDANNIAYLTADNITFSALGTGNTISGVVLFRQGVSNAASDLIAFYEITPTPTNGGDVTIQFASAGNGGVLRLA